MNNSDLEKMLDTELEKIKGGAASDDVVCVCENGGAAATVIVVEDPEPIGPNGPIQV